MSKNDRGYDYKLKHCATAISMDNEEKLNELIEETDSLANDPTKNEKVSVTLRVIVNKNNNVTMPDVSARLDKSVENNLLDGNAIKQYIPEYKKYVINLFNDKKSGFSEFLRQQHGEVNLEDLKFEIVKTYYPLDFNNLKEEIPNLGNFIQYFKKAKDNDSNLLTMTVDCSKEDKPVPSFDMLPQIASMAQRVKEMREITKAEELSPYKNKTLH